MTVLFVQPSAKGHVEQGDFPVGSYVYYYRAQHADGTGSKYAPAGRWRGPALVCAVEEPTGSRGGAVLLGGAWQLARALCP